MNLNGKKQPKQASTKQKLKELETKLTNSEMATRISQMMIKQLLDNFQALRVDLDNTMGILNDFQYRTRAMLELGDFNVDELNTLAEKYKLTDYMKASDAEDEAKGYTIDNDGVIDENSIIIITSTTNGNEDKGIFRSKFKLNECSTESLREQLLGKKVGDVVTQEINGDIHDIAILELRRLPEEATEGTNGETNESN